MELATLDSRSAILDVAMNFARIGRFLPKSPATAAPFMDENAAYFREMDGRVLPASFLPTYRAAKRASGSLAGLPPEAAADVAFTWASLLERRAKFCMDDAP